MFPKNPVDTERVVVDGVEWQYSQYYKSWHTVKNTGFRDVVCGNCGNFEVTIGYGDYECIATCLKCNHRFVVYDG